MVILLSSFKTVLWRVIFRSLQTGMFFALLTLYCQINKFDQIYPVIS